MREIIFANVNYIDDNIIQKLDNLAQNVTEQKESHNLPYDFIEKAILLYIKNNGYCEVDDLLEGIPLKKWKIISLTLEFFKSVDSEIYKKIKNIIFSKNSKIKLNIYKLSEVKNFNENDFEFKNFRRYSKNPFNQRWDNRDIVYIPLEDTFRKGEEKKNVLQKDEGSLKDVYILVHELTHTLDMYLGYIINKHKNIISGELYDNNSILTESIAVGMERYLTNYLLDNKICNTNNVRESFIIRANDTINACYFAYTRLALARKKQKNGKITKKDIDEAAGEMDLGIEGKNQLVDILINKKNKDFFTGIEYALSGILAPTIQNMIRQGKIGKVKEYIKLSRIGDFENALKALEITLDEEGLKKLEHNMIAQRFQFEKIQDEEER